MKMKFDFLEDVSRVLSTYFCVYPVTSIRIYSDDIFSMTLNIDFLCDDKEYSDFYTWNGSSWEYESHFYLGE